MGIVYRAYHPELDRCVAIKVLRPGLARGTARQLRFVREGRLLARLAHPNVVTVHDVVADGKQTYLVMEWVEGTTLAEWLASGSRSRGQILAVFRQAARGLAAAHKLGVVHRDFKPSNVLIGSDGRVRVADFGVAGMAGNSTVTTPESVPTPGLANPSQDPALAPTLGSHDAITQAGTLIGTPAFMSPEQRAGLPVGPRSDQYSFCLVLSGALGGNGHPLSRRLRRALARGLSENPLGRHRSMDAVLALLDRETRTRAGAWRAVAALLTLFVVTGAAMFTLRALRSPCRAPDRFLRDVWDASRRASVQRKLAPAGASPILWRRMQTVFDEYAHNWKLARAGACKGGVDAVTQRRVACLDDRLHDLDASVRLIDDLDATIIGKAVTSPLQLPALAACEPAHLDAVPDPPADPRTRSEVWRLRAEIAQARLLVETRRAISTAARALAERIHREAAQVGYRPLVAEALYLLGDTAYWDQRPDDARASYNAAVRTADETHHDRVRAMALIDFLYLDVLGPLGVSVERAESVRAVLDRIGGDDPIASNLGAALGVAFQVHDQEESALKSFLAAAAALRRRPADSPGLLSIVLNRGARSASRLGRHAEAERLAREAADVGAHWLEPEHRRKDSGHVTLAWVLGQAHRRDEARAVMAEVPPGAFARFPGDAIVATDTYLELGMYEEARSAAESALPKADDVNSTRSVLLFNLGQAELQLTAPARALTRFMAARAHIRKDATNVPSRMDALTMCIAQARYDLHGDPAQLRQVRRLLARLKDSAPFKGEYERAVAWLSTRARVSRARF
jgi:tetratricopeptide (TPR) repeat protein